MSCRVQKGKAILPNGKTSELYEDLKIATRDSNEATKIYDDIHSAEFKKWYGKDWEKDYNVDLFTDNNGEPKLAYETGYVSFKNNKGDTWEIPVEVKEKSSVLNIGRELQDELINTIVNFVNTVKENNPETFKGDVNKYFGLAQDTEEKGDLADKLLLEAFQGLDDIQEAKRLYKILTTEGKDAFVEALPEGVSMNTVPGAPNNASQIFIFAYHNWNTERNPITGNIEKVGVREILKDSLSSYGMKLSDRAGTMEEFDDTPEKIYSMSSLEENPRDKLSSEARSILGNIKLGTLNSFGYPVIMSMDKAYSIMAEAAVGEPTFADMRSKLDWYALYKPEAVALRAKLDTLTPQEEAALFTNFKTAYNNFILFKSELYTDPITGQISTTNKIINSNQSQISKKAKEKFRENSRQRLIPNDRAIYMIDADNKISVKEDKKELLVKLWDQISAVNSPQRRGQWDTEDILALGEYLWTLGMQYGPSLETTQENLLRYYNLGNEEGVAENNLFSRLVFEPGNNLNKFVNSINQENPKDIYREHSSLVDKLVDIAPLFESKPFGSFISGTNKQYYPINLPTRLHELTSEINNPKEADGKIKLLTQLLTDPLNRPYGSIKHSSPLISALHNSEEARKNFIHEVLDSYKSSDELVASSDYDNQTSKISLIERLLAYQNRGSKNFTKVALPIQAGRQSLDFLTIPRISSYLKFGVSTNRKQLIENLILQDLARMDQANELIIEAFKMSDPSILIEGYHYKNIADPYAADGSAFTMTQISGLQNTILKDGTEMSDYTKDYILNKQFVQREEFETLLNDKINDVENKIKLYEEDIVQRINSYGIDLFTEVSSELDTDTKRNKFLKDFIFENFIGKIEITKVLRGGFSFAKNTEDFYKRMALLKTPGNKLFIKGMSETDPTYGMPPTYNTITIRDFDFTDKERANEIADSLSTTLQSQGIDMFTAEEIAKDYRSVNKSDAQSFISLPMYRGIMQGLGQWTVKDEEAYNNARNPEVGRYIDNSGQAMPIYPLKPFHEELSLQNSVNTLYMDKNSYTVVTPELAMFYPYLSTMLDAMNNGIDVVNTVSATKGARRNVQDFEGTGNLDVSNPTVMDSKMLRFPQMMPRTKKDELAFNRQIRKNITANIFPTQQYKLGDVTVSGSLLYKIYGESIAANINEDRVNLEKELGITQIKKLRGREGTKEYRDAKLNYLINVRDKMARQIKDRDLPDNYLEALNIVPNGAFDWTFKIPLAFPNYQAKFEGIFMSTYNNELFNQKFKGKELVQIAELGGHTLSGELEFYDGTNAAQIRIKASALGLEPNVKLEDVPKEKLQVIGYRIPQQGKNSSLFMEVVDFLPESHEKAIMVPGAITVQMGSDFDIDKLNIILPEVDTDGNVVKPDYSVDPSKMSRKERNNVVFDVFKSILTDAKHLEEVIKPLDIQSLRDSKAFLSDKIGVDTTIDYNSPLAEIAMEERTKEGASLIGLWANHLAGRNVSETAKLLRLKPEFMLSIDNVNYGDLGVTKDIKGNYTDANISEHLSGATDYAKEPIQLDINDNIYTNPVLGLFYSLGLPIDTALNFVNQPIIREITDDAKLNARSLGEFNQSIDKIAKKYKINNPDFAPNFPMSSIQLQDNLSEADPELQAQYLLNFKTFYKAGRALQTVNKIITPDNIDNVNELSSVIAWIDRENLYLNNVDSLISGAEEFILHNKGTDKPLNPIGVAYRGIFDTILEEAGRAGFINNSPAFNTFKDNLKESLGVSRFTDKQHKLIDRALFLKIMTQPNSPFIDGGIISENTFRNMYINPNNNLVTKLEEIKVKYPELNNNLFVQALEEDPSNKETGLFLLRLDLPIGISTTDKNQFSDSLNQLISSPNEEIRDFGKSLVVNQILTSGFNPTFGSYIDLIPTEALTTNMLNTSAESPVEFFRQEATALTKTDYFDNFQHEFVRTYGLQSPGGVPLLKTIRKIKMSPDGFVSFNKQDSRIYGDNNLNLDYFLSYATGQANVFVNVENGKYQRLSMLGKSRKLNESGISSSNSESLVNFAVNTTTDRPGAKFQQPKPPVIGKEDQQAQKVCKS